MQIYGTSQLHGAQALNGPHNSNRPSAAANSPASISRSSGDQLDISPAAQLASKIADLPEIRADRVAQIKAAIADGTYETNERLEMALERFLDLEG